MREHRDRAIVAIKILRKTDENPSEEDVRTLEAHFEDVDNLARAETIVGIARKLDAAAYE